MDKGKNAKVLRGVILALSILVMSMLTVLGISPTKAFADARLVDVPVRTIWDDNNDEYGLRPDKVKFTVSRGSDQSGIGDLDDYAASTVVATKTVTAADNWQHTFTGLQAYHNNGKPCVYYVTQEYDNDLDGEQIYSRSPVDDGGSQPINGSVSQFIKEAGHTRVSFKNTPLTGRIRAVVAWNEKFGSSNRPDAITVHLRRNGEEIRSLRISGGKDENEWNDNGYAYDLGAYPLCLVRTKAFVLTADPIMPADEADRLDWCPAIYDARITLRDDGEVFTVAEVENYIWLDIAKAWQDDNDAYGARPSSVNVKLLQNGTEKQSVSISAPLWYENIGDLPLYADGKGIVYSISEDEVEGYGVGYGKETEKSFASRSSMKLVATNTYAGEGTKTIPFKVVLSSNGLTPYKKPASINVRLFAEEGGDYPQGSHAEGTDAKHLTTQGEAFWRGTDTGRSTIITEPSQVLDDKLVYEGEFQGVPMYGENGEQRNFWIAVDEGTSPRYSQTDAYSLASIDLANPDDTISTKVAEADFSMKETVDIKVNKAWDDEGHEDARPESITYRLYKMTADAGSGGFAISSSEPELVATAQATADGGWSATFADVPMPTPSERYLVGEDRVPNYDEVKAYTYDEAGGTYKGTSGFNAFGISRHGFASERLREVEITNTYKPVYKTFNIQMSWVDEGHESERPETVLVRIASNSTSTLRMQLEKRDAEISDDGTVWTWKDKFANLKLPYLDENGNEIDYQITEVEPANYKVTNLEVGRGQVADVKIENTYAVAAENGQVNVEIEWSDINDQFKNRPESVDVSLQKRVGEDWVDVDAATITAADGWTHAFEVPITDATGAKIAYRAQETPIPAGYRVAAYSDEGAEFEGDDTTVYLSVSNSLVPANRWAITKVWDDEGHEAERPEKIAFDLYEHDDVLDTREVDAAKEGNTQNISFNGLGDGIYPAYRNGEPAEYKVVERPVDGYTTEFGVWTEDVEANTLGLGKGWGDWMKCTVTNVYSKKETVSIHLVKRWMDEGYEDDRPDSITVHLLRGSKLVYSNDGAAVSFFSTVEDGQEVAQATASKDDAEIIEDGADVVWVWDDVFTDLPTTDENGEKVVYAITEDVPEGYENVLSLNGKSDIGIRGWNLTNKHKAATKSYNVQKTWHDEGYEEDRPDSITVRLVKGDEEIARRDLSKNDAEVSGNGRVWTWRGVFADLELPYLDENGEEIDYRFFEVAPENYEITNLENSGGEVADVHIGNTHIAPTTLRVSVYKHWVDEGHEDERPASVTLRLIGNGEEVEAKEVSAEDEWRTTFDAPILDEDGEKIAYEVAEDAIEGYETEYAEDRWEDTDSFMVTITNTYAKVAPAPETRDIAIRKVWDDSDNKDGLRPDHITVRLLADGETVTTLDVEARYSWMASIAGLRKDDEEGNEIVYTLEEEAVDGYTTSISGNAADGFVITNTHTVAKAAPRPHLEPAKPDLPQLGGGAVAGCAAITAAISGAGYAISRKMRH